MAATGYHFDCRPESSATGDYKTMNTKFDGTCAGCAQPYEKGDKVALFFDGPPPDRQQGSRSQGNAAPNKDVFAALHKCQQDIIGLKAEMNTLRGMIRANGNPSAPVAMDVVAEIFDGEEVAF